MQQDIEISNRFETLTYLDEEEDVEREWQKCKTAVRESNEAAVGFKKKASKPWLSEAKQSLVEERKSAKKRET